MWAKEGKRETLPQRDKGRREREREREKERESNLNIAERLFCSPVGKLSRVWGKLRYSDDVPSHYVKGPKAHTSTYTLNVLKSTPCLIYIWTPQQEKRERSAPFGPLFEQQQLRGDPSLANNGIHHFSPPPRFLWGEEEASIHPFAESFNQIRPWE